MVSKSKSSTASTNSQSDTTINTVDNREGGDNAIFGGNTTLHTGSNSTNNITTTDLGAVSGGLDLALESLRSISSATANSSAAVKSVASDSIAQAYGLANEARQSETSGAINNFLKYGVWLAGAIVVAVVLVKLKK